MTGLGPELEGTADPSSCYWARISFGADTTVHPGQNWWCGEEAVSDGYSMRLVQRDKAGGLVLTSAVGSAGSPRMVLSVARRACPDRENHAWGVPGVCWQGVRVSCATAFPKARPDHRRRGRLSLFWPTPTERTGMALDRSACRILALDRPWECAVGGGPHVCPGD